MIQDEYTLKALKRNIEMLKKACKCGGKDRCDPCQCRMTNERTVKLHEEAVAKDRRVPLYERAEP